MYTPSYAKPQVLSVSQLNFYIKSLIDNDPRLTTVFLEGEISNFTCHSRSGHLYFSLKDQKAVVRAVMFAGNARRLPFMPENGMKIICHGRVTVYEPSGQYQIIIEDMQPQGVGALALAYEQLKRELAAKGLFDQAHKKPIPRFPDTVGVVTSPTGAAIRDIRNVIGRRYPRARIILCPVLVQGEGAAPQLVNAVEQLGQNRLCDVMIVGRGGGSMEDLWAFNSRELAYAIYRCPVPVISAVGHETDFTICDFVSDLRAPTPSAAAELAVPDTAEVTAHLIAKLRAAGASVDRRRNSAFNRVASDGSRAYDAVVRQRLEPTMAQCNAQVLRLRSAAVQLAHETEKRLVAAQSKLQELDPDLILNRGYAMVEKDDQPVNTASALEQGDFVTLRFSDGVKHATIGE